MCGIIYKDENVLAIDKPARISVGQLTELLPNTELPRKGIVHRLDKETSGLMLVAKNSKTLLFLQKQFKNREVIKKYISLVSGTPKEEQGEIKTIVDRAPSGKKQKAYLAFDPELKNKEKRWAVTRWKILKKYREFSLIEATPKTGRKHQIRVHLAYLGHPIVGDKLYAFKNQPCPRELKRHFLHAGYLEIKLPDGQTKAFQAELPEDLIQALKTLK